ncbi:hypothetical protein P0M11_06465 [Kaistella sp. PBT33-4]|uniref:hypothetical protein n=1 Tax=Kaistella sp. PBT33-4 TaxID=3032000 RepID=UPI0023D8315A|nr:hypothetical protein [Kaistella sp. PBT33-4]MDF0719641.1 hypothetical protein [Kaistella sp. PBT33-4]
MMKLKLTALTLMLVSGLSFAQKVKYSKEEMKEMDNYMFGEMFTGFSPKKETRIILKDAGNVKGNARDMDRKKGQIYSVKIRNTATGKDETYKAEDIAEMYLPVSGFEKGMRTANYFNKISNWSRKSPSKITEKDEVYLRNQTVSLKNKKAEKEYLMQLINPDFSSIIEVYADPVASETTGVTFGMGPLTSPQVGGGVTKSFYVRKGDRVIWLKKADFEEHYNFLFGDNKEFMAKYPAESVKWDYFSWLVFQYTKMTEEAKG